MSVFEVKAKINDSVPSDVKNQFVNSAEKPTERSSMVSSKSTDTNPHYYSFDGGFIDNTPTRPRIEPGSPDPESNALTTRPVRSPLGILISSRLKLYSRIEIELNLRKGRNKLFWSIKNSTEILNKSKALDLALSFIDKI